MAGLWSTNRRTKKPFPRVSKGESRYAKAEEELCVCHGECIGRQDPFTCPRVQWKAGYCKQCYRGLAELHNPKPSEVKPSKKEKSEDEDDGPLFGGDDEKESESEDDEGGGLFD